MPTAINSAFLRLTRRAEINDRQKLASIFVDVGPLFALLSSHDHQVVFGRRGTGKTHVLSYLADRVAANGDLAIYIDVRTVGSTGGLYADVAIPLPERATRLLVDLLLHMHDSLVDQALADTAPINLAAAGPLLDSLAETITRIRVEGTVEQASTARAAAQHEREQGVGLQAGVDGAAKLSGHADARTAQTAEAEQTWAQAGTPRHVVHFGAVGRILTQLVRSVEPHRLWLLMDEWSHIPLDLQPIVADFMRRCLLPVRGLTVKVAAIEQRTSLMLLLPDGSYMGLELGADIAADVNLDDFMVFENDEERAKSFFTELIYKHCLGLENTDLGEAGRTSQELIRLAFTQRNVFGEFVRAAEGVPRDAINTLILAARRADMRAISMTDLRASARDWYQRDKATTVRANTEAFALLHWIIDKVIGERRARAFLLRTDVRHSLIDALFDSRVLHILKRNISAHDQPGVRYDAYKLDYGCYVDLINTARDTQGLFACVDMANGTGQIPYIDVPPDDYRSIRRAILDLTEFERRPGIEENQ